MTLHQLPDRPTEPVPDGSGPEVRAVLDEARAVGVRAGAWLRALAAREGECPKWMRGRPNPLLGLADAVEQALGGLDPDDMDQRDGDGHFTGGHGGVPPELRERLWEGSSLFRGAFGGNGLSPAETAGLLALVGAVRLAADLWSDGDYPRDLPVLLRAIDHTLPDGPAEDSPATTAVPALVRG